MNRASLTIRGRADTRRLGRVLARRGVRFTLIVTSPLVRAVQTAEIVAAAVGYRGRMPASDLLEPEAAAAGRGRVPRGRLPTRSRWRWWRTSRSCRRSRRR